MKTFKGQEGTPIEAIIGLIFALFIAAIVIVLLFPALRGAEDTASCVGLLRNIGSIIADITGVSIC